MGRRWGGGAGDGGGLQNQKGKQFALPLETGSPYTHSLLVHEEETMTVSTS